MIGSDMNKGLGVRLKRIRKPFKKFCSRCGRKYIKLGKFHRVCPKCQKQAHIEAIVKIQRRNRLKLPNKPTEKELVEIMEYLWSKI